MCLPDERFSNDAVCLLLQSCFDLSFDERSWQEQIKGLTSHQTAFPFSLLFLCFNSAAREAEGTQKTCTSQFSLSVHFFYESMLQFAKFWRDFAARVPPPLPASVNRHPRPQQTTSSVTITFLLFPIKLISKVLLIHK